MKKKDIYEISLKLFGTYLIIQYAMFVLTNIWFLQFGHFADLFNNALLKGMLFGLTWFVVGIMLVFKTDLLLKLLRLQNHESVGAMTYFQTAHVAVMVLAGVLVVGNLGSVYSTVFKTEEKQLCAQEGTPADSQNPSANYNRANVETRNTNYGSIVAVAAGVLILSLSGSIAKRFVSAAGKHERGVETPE